MAMLGGRLVLFGGSAGGPAPLDDTWTFDGTQWLELFSPGPSPRENHSMATSGQRVIVFGGRNLSQDLGDTWAFDGSNWTELKLLPTPSPRHDAAMATLP